LVTVQLVPVGPLTPTALALVPMILAALTMETGLLVSVTLLV